MHYVGTFKRTGEIFDSSKKAGQPIGFQVGMRQAGRFFVKNHRPMAPENFLEIWYAQKCRFQINMDRWSEDGMKVWLDLSPRRDQALETIGKPN